MPEKPEVITVSKKLKLNLINKVFKEVDVLYNNIIIGNVDEFKKKLIDQRINDITTRGKWIVFTLDNYLLLTHLRMEGKFFYRTKEDKIKKHEHVIFTFDDGVQLRFNDVRKFGKMVLLDKNNYLNEKPFTELGYEYNDKDLSISYLKDKYKNKKLPIKTVLLDQSIITGIGNIYADEILFLSGINPLIKCSDLDDKDLENIIINTKKVLDKAILEGGTTIRSYTSEEGVTGLFQNSLQVHQRVGKKCYNCGNTIIKIKVGGRGTYYCPKCQK